MDNVISMIAKSGKIKEKCASREKYPVMSIILIKYKERRDVRMSDL